jgi:hypothetical protein
MAKSQFQNIAAVATLPGKMGISDYLVLAFSTPAWDPQALFLHLSI